MEVVQWVIVINNTYRTDFTLPYHFCRIPIVLKKLYYCLDTTIKFAILSTLTTSTNYIVFC